MNTLIRFKRHHLQFRPGQAHAGYGYGICCELVRRGVAEWVQDAPGEQEACPVAPQFADTPIDNRAMQPRRIHRKKVTT